MFFLTTPQFAKQRTDQKFYNIFRGREF